MYRIIPGRFSNKKDIFQDTIELPDEKRLGLLVKAHEYRQRLQEVTDPLEAAKLAAAEELLSKKMLTVASLRDCVSKLADKDEEVDSTLISNGHIRSAFRVMYKYVNGEWHLPELVAKPKTELGPF